MQDTSGPFPFMRVCPRKSVVPPANNPFLKQGTVGCGGGGYFRLGVLLCACGSLWGCVVAGSAHFWGGSLWGGGGVLVVLGETGGVEVFRRFGFGGGLLVGGVLVGFGFVGWGGGLGVLGGVGWFLTSPFPVLPSDPFEKGKIPTFLASPG